MYSFGKVLGYNYTSWLGTLIAVPFIYWFLLLVNLLFYYIALTAWLPRCAGKGRGAELATGCVCCLGEVAFATLIPAICTHSARLGRGICIHVCQQAAGHRQKGSELPSLPGKSVQKYTRQAQERMSQAGLLQGLVPPCWSPSSAPQSTCCCPGSWPCICPHSVSSQIPSATLHSSTPSLLQAFSVVPDFALCSPAAASLLPLLTFFLPMAWEMLTWDRTLALLQHTPGKSPFPHVGEGTHLMICATCHHRFPLHLSAPDSQQSSHLLSLCPVSTGFSTV